LSDANDTPDDQITDLEPTEKEPLWALEPVRTESGAFKALIWVVGSCLVVIAAVVIARAV